LTLRYIPSTPGLKDDNYTFTSILLRERERERESWEGGSERHYRVGGEVIETKFDSFEGSQAVPSSPCVRGEACIGDFFNFDFKDVEAAVVGEMSSDIGRAILRPNLGS
jgi:hypothetical protein